MLARLSGGLVFGVWWGCVEVPDDERGKLPRHGGAFNHFEGGSVYWSPQTGAHQVWGQDEWALRGWGVLCGFRSGGRLSDE